MAAVFVGAMPQRPSKVCGYPGCQTLTQEKSGRCPAHPGEWERQGQQPTERMRGRKLQAARATLFRDSPLCEQCERLGLIRVATQRDHRVPLAQGGTDAPDNTQALCDECHRIKTQAEAKFGRWRGESKP